LKILKKAGVRRSIDFRIKLVTGFLFLFLFTGARADSPDVATNTVPMDSSAVNSRLPSASSRDYYHKNEDFQYKEDTPTKDQKNTEQTSSNRSEGLFAGLFALLSSFWTLIEIVFILGIALLIYMFFGKEIRSLFYSSPKEHVELQIIPENIHEINFDKQAQEALKAGNYRLAVRLYYLRSLKLLSDRRLIEWRENKTNLQYLEEIHGNAIETDFFDIMVLFNRFWYGGFPIGEQNFPQVKERFDDFYKHLKPAR
jgi:hypothetical protein